jgi:urease accessory protein
VKRSALLTSSAVAILGYSAVADAHIVSTRLGDFFTGALHPLTDPVDWAVWVAVALLGAIAGRSAARWLVVTTPLALMVGLLLTVVTGARVVGLTIDGLSLVFVGGLLASGRRLTVTPLLITTSAVLLARGLANAAGLRVGADVALYVSGLGMAGYVAVTLWAALAVTVLDQAQLPAWRRIGVRVLGSWMAAVGLLLFAFGLRG